MLGIWVKTTPPVDMSKQDGDWFRLNTIGSNLRHRYAFHQIYWAPTPEIAQVDMQELRSIFDAEAQRNQDVLKYELEIREIK